jgi:2-dehydro-3-deoxygalactonokinase
MSTADLIAVDWGTTNRRVYVLDVDGGVIETRRDDRGILGFERKGFADEAASIRAQFGDVPILCAGMVGSVNGWTDAGYRPCPAGLGDLAAALDWVEPGRTAIVPGVCSPLHDRADVMRGEEVQFLGAVAAGMAPGDALLCQPGTHCKWAHMADGRIERFRTSMTGELFALLKAHSLLSALMTGEVVDGSAFRAGVAASAVPGLLGDLFGARAQVLLGRRNRNDIAAYVSGLLIGHDVREQGLTGRHVHLLAEPGLGTLYSVAIAAAGGNASLIDSHAAFVAGIARIWRLYR